MANILIITGSPRNNGNSDNIAKLAKEEIENKGSKAEIFQIRDNEINFCKGCNNCKQKGSCVFNDDATKLITKINDYDSLVFVSPVYFGNLPGMVKSFIDRTYAIFDPVKLQNPTDKKVVVVLTYGTSPEEQIMPIYSSTTFCLGVLGFFDGKNVLCSGNLAPNEFLENETQQKYVKEAVDWLL